jgi:heparosan-N-sulfate-glucuronate 5-epimerase
VTEPANASNAPAAPAPGRPGPARRIVLAVTREVDDMLGRGPWFTHQPIGPNLDPARLAGYYCDFRHKAELPRQAGETAGAAARRVFSGGVIPIAQAGLGTWELLVEGSPREADFLSLADALVAEAVPGPDGHGVAWYTRIPVVKYGLHKPWPSAMGQGEAISVLLRAHQLTGRDEYARVARAAFEPMRLDVARGGTSRRLDGRLVLEEYPTAQPTAVLNGWIFALFGLHELATHAHPPAGDLFDESMAGLLSLLPRYDVGWWSRYSLHEHALADVAKPFYQRLHPVLLRALHLIRPDDRLLLMAERWERQLSRRGLARAAANKLVFRAVREVRAGRPAAAVG